MSREEVEERCSILKIVSEVVYRWLTAEGPSLGPCYR